MQNSYKTFNDLIEDLYNEDVISIPYENKNGINFLENFIDKIKTKDELIVFKKENEVEIKLNDLLIGIKDIDSELEVEIKEDYSPSLDLNILEEKEEHEVYSMVERIHPNYEDAFVDGDLGERLEEFSYYHLYNESLDVLDENEWYVCDDKVDEYVEKIREEGIKNMPPLVISEDGSIIDGIHRLNALKKVGIKEFKCYIGSNKNIEQLKLENFIKEKSMPKEDLVFKKIQESKNKRNIRVLFHSGDASIDNDLKEGIVPTFGDWLEEVLQGAVDDEDFMEEIRNNDEVSFFDTKPSWYKMKAARALKKSHSQLTEKDIEKAGQLSVVFYDIKDEKMLQAGIRGGDYVEKSTYLGKKEIADYELPFGVETGDIYTRETVIPEYTLTGQNLLKFINKYYPEHSIDNKIKNSSLKPKH